MQLCTGDMWTAYDDSDLFLITTNSYIYQGRLVMGAGIAQEARERFTGIEIVLGKAIVKLRRSGGVYGLLVSERWPQAKLGCFQSKIGLGDSPLWLIEYSTMALQLWCHEHPGKRVDLNFPGIGCGNLLPDDVLPIIYRLPDQVHIWRNDVD